MISYTTSPEGITPDMLRGFFVGFITAITDHVSCAYVPHLEVVPDHQGNGIGSELVRRMVELLDGLYMVDLLCDPDVQPFYERSGFRRATGMCLRNYDYQAGSDTSLPTAGHG